MSGHTSAQTHAAEPVDESAMSRATQLLSHLSTVSARIAAATTTTPGATAPAPVRLVAVSKLKPASDIAALLNAPLSHHSPVDDYGSNNNKNNNQVEAQTQPRLLHFGENYVQELLEKSQTIQPASDGAGVRWHFIGGLQSNKCVALARDVRGLWAVESVDSEKKAALLDKGWRERLERERGQQQAEKGENQEKQTPPASEPRLRIFVQINTSDEDTKSGVPPAAAASLCHFILTRCPHLYLQGLMTIGAIARSQATPSTARAASTGEHHAQNELENADFATLCRVRDDVEAALQQPESKEQKNRGEEAIATATPLWPPGRPRLELSMGMSEDYEAAVRMGSGQVRVGSTIFGVRPHRGAHR